MNILSQTNDSLKVLSHSESDTESVGAFLAERVKMMPPPCFVAMFGDLGAGKTAFVRGFASVLSPGSRVKSPSYTIVNEYRKGDIPLFHFDFYRISSSEELFAIGFDEYIVNGFCIAEWCEKLDGELPAGCITVNISKQSDNERLISIDMSSLMTGSERDK